MKKLFALGGMTVLLISTSASAQDVALHPYYQRQYLELGYAWGDDGDAFAGSLDMSIGIPFGGGFGQTEPGLGGSGTGFGLNLGARVFSFDGETEFTAFGGFEYTFDGGNRALLVGVPDAAIDDYTIRNPFMLNETLDYITGGLLFDSVTGIQQLFGEQYAYGLRYDAMGGFKNYGASLHFFDGGTTLTYGGLTPLGDELVISTGLEAIFDSGDTEIGGNVGFRYEPASIAGLGFGATAGFPVVTGREFVGQVDLDYDFSSGGRGLPFSVAASYLGGDGFSAFSVGSTYQITDALSASAAYGDFDGENLYSINLNLRPVYSQ